MYKKVKARFIKGEDQILKDIGVEIKDGKFDLKEIRINLNSIAYLDEYEGMICINFSAIEEDTIITDLPWSEENIKYLEQ